MRGSRSSPRSATAWSRPTRCSRRVGRLSIPVLGLQVPLYDPMMHYQQVRDSWIGIRTPDGR